MRVGHLTMRAFRKLCESGRLVDRAGATAHDGAGSAADENDADSDGHVVGHGVSPAGRVGQILANPERKDDADHGELASDDLEGETPIPALVQGFDLVGCQVAFFDGEQGVGHGFSLQKASGAGDPGHAS
jgi:hypothetical protein